MYKRSIWKTSQNDAPALVDIPGLTNIYFMQYVLIFSKGNNWTISCGKQVNYGSMTDIPDINIVKSSA